MNSLLTRYKVVTNPKFELSFLANNDDGNLMKQTDFLFLIFSTIRSLAIIINQWNLNSQPWMVLLISILGIVGGYVITRYLVSYLIWKISKTVTNQLTLGQSRFILSNTLIPIIFYFLLNALLQYLYIVRVIEAELFTATDSFLYLITSILSMRIFILGIMELYELEIQKAVVIALPIIVFLGIGFLY